MINNFQGKNIWIIGASFGIGEELYRQFSALGANLAVSARSTEKLERLVADYKNHLAIAADVSSVDSIKLAWQQLKSSWSKVDLIIFSVGTYQPMSVDNFNLDKAKSIIDINLVSCLNLLDAILPEVKSQKIAHLAIISSVAGYFGMNNSLAYGASKAGLSNLVESLSLELKKYHTKVTLISPGFVKTRLTDQNNFKMPLILSVQEAGELIIKNLTKNKFEIAFPWLFCSVMKLIRLLPYRIKMIILAKIK